MSDIEVTKRGRPKKYKSDAERQRAYRDRKADEKAARTARPLTSVSKRGGEYRVVKVRYREIDPNRFYGATVESYRMGGEFAVSKCPATSKPLDRTLIPGWIDSLRESRRNLNRLIRFLKKL